MSDDLREKTNGLSVQEMRCIWFVKNKKKRETRRVYATCYIFLSLMMMMVELVDGKK